MLLDEEFEVKFKDKDSPQQRKMLLDALVDLYNNINKYHIVKRIDSNDQTSRFMDRFYITQGDIATLLEDYAFTLKVTEWGDILDDRDRPNNLLYILYIPNAKVGNWESSKSREKLLYIKWNPKNRNIISFHTMSAVQQTNRDKLMESKMKITEEKFEIYNTHMKYRFINRWCNLYYDKVSENLFVLYDGYIETVDQVKPTEFEHIYDGYTLCKSTDKIVQIWKRDRKLEEKLSYNDIIDRVFYTGNDNWHLKKFYDLRKGYNGKDVKNVKLIATDISDEGYCDILFAVEATKDGTKKKELVGMNGEMRDNPTNEYQVTIRINDFWDLIEEFGLETKGDFTKADVVALVQLSQDIKLSSNDASFWWQGLSYWLTLDDASLMPCYIQPKFWDKFRPNVKVSKIIEAVLRQFGFFTQQIAMSIKRALIQQNYL